MKKLMIIASLLAVACNDIEPIKQLLIETGAEEISVKDA